MSRTTLRGRLRGLSNLALLILDLLIVAIATSSLLALGAVASNAPGAAPREVFNPGPIALPPEAPRAISSPVALMADKGKFRIMAGGQQVGSEVFEIAPSGGDWVARGTSDVKTADGMTHVTGTLELHADGTPVHYEWSTVGAKKAAASIGFSGATASIELRVDGARPFTQQFTFNSAQIAVLDNNLYHQYAVLARLYDWNKKGAQTFSVLVPQEMTPGSVTVESLGQKEEGGKNLDELQVKTEDLELDLYLENQRLMRIDAPEANAEIVRE